MRSSSNVAIVVGYRNKAEIGGAAANITDQDNITGADQGAPLPACLRDPGVKCRLRFLEQRDFAQASSLGGFGGQTSRNLIE